MKIRTTSSILIALILGFLALDVTPAQAIIVNWQPVGLALGQTARVTAANTGARSITLTSVTFLDGAGIVLGQFVRQVIQPGMMMSFDLEGDKIIREGNRTQIRVVIFAASFTGLVHSTEIFENDTGKTTVLSDPPEPD